MIKPLVILILSLSSTLTPYGQNPIMAIGKNERPVLNDSTIVKSEVTINGQQLVKVMQGRHFKCLTTLSGDTIVNYEDYYTDISFLDINGDGYKDIRVFAFSNTPNQCDNYLFDSRTKKFMLIEGCDLDITLIKGTTLFYTYNRIGCDDNYWESHLCKIENWKEIDIGHLEGKDCGDADDGIKIYKVLDQNKDKENLIKTMPIPKFDNNGPNNKWAFIKHYWSKNYKLFY